MLVLGLDPGLALTGWALVDGDRGRISLRQAGCFSTPKQLEEGQRLLLLWRSVNQLISTWHPDEVALERLFFSRNISTAMAVSQARGVLVCATAVGGLRIAEYTPNQVKQSVTGNGAATKAQVARMVRTLLGATVPSGPDDITDACAVGICHQHSAGLRRSLAASGAR